MKAHTSSSASCLARRPCSPFAHDAVEVGIWRLVLKRELYDLVVGKSRDLRAHGRRADLTPHRVDRDPLVHRQRRAHHAEMRSISHSTDSVALWAEKGAKVHTGRRRYVSEGVQQGRVVTGRYDLTDGGIDVAIEFALAREVQRDAKEAGLAFTIRGLGPPLTQLGTHPYRGGPTRLRVTRALLLWP